MNANEFYDHNTCLPGRCFSDIGDDCTVARRTWEIGDECVVRDATRVWKIIGWLGDGFRSPNDDRIADLAPVGFTFTGTHSSSVRNLREVPR